MPQEPNWLFPLLEGLLRAIQEPLSPSEQLESRSDMEQILRERGLYWIDVHDTPALTPSSQESCNAPKDAALPDFQSKETLGHQ